MHQIKKRALCPLLSKSVNAFRVPGQGTSRYPGENWLLLGLFRLLGLLRLLRLLRFLSHSILSGLMDWNATREACSAEGQPRNILSCRTQQIRMPLRTRCHAAVIALLYCCH